jgi:hypothetical protein
MLDFFPQHHPTSTKDMLPFSKSQIFTLSPQLSTLHALFGLGGLLLLFPCFLGTFCFLEGKFSQNQRQRNTKQIMQQFKHN